MELSLSIAMRTLLSNICIRSNLSTSSKKIRYISLQNLVGGFRPPIYQVHHYFLFLALLTSVHTCKQRVYPDVNPDSLIGGINTRYAIGHKMLNTVCRI